MSLRSLLQDRPPPTLLVLVLLAGMLVSGCAPRPASEAVPGGAEPGVNTLSAEEQAAGWTLLFDGETLDAWRGFGRDDVPGSWQAQDGTIYFQPGGQGGDLVTRESYGDFELALEWRIAECGNSGIFYRGREEGYRSVWETAPEMQVIDNECHPDARYPSHRAGANYDLHTPPPGVVRPVGEWNETRVVARGPHVEHWLNGVSTATYEQGSDEWQARVAVSKFREMPDYGRFMDGIIALQDHGDAVWFRNVRIRRLDG